LKRRFAKCFAEKYQLDVSRQNPGASCTKFFADSIRCPSYDCPAAWRPEIASLERVLVEDYTNSVREGGGLQICQVAGKDLLAADRNWRFWQR